MQVRMNLRNRILIPVTVVMIIGMLITAVISYRNSKEAITQIVSDSMVATIDASNKQIDAWVTDIVADLSSWSKSAEVIRVLQTGEGVEAANAILQTLKSNYPAYENLGVLNKDGLVISGSEAAVIGKLNLKTRAYFQDGMAGKTSISKPVASRSTGNPIFVAGIPVEANGKVIGVIFAAVDLSGFSEVFIDPLKIGKEGYGFVTDKDGVLIAHPDKQRILKVNTRDYAIGKEMMKTQNAGKVVSYELNGEEKILVFGIEPYTGWTIGVTASPEDIYSSVITVRNVNLYSTLVLAVVVALFLFLLVSPIVKTLKRGVSFATAVKEGDTSQRLDLTRSDELGDLSRALNEMADSMSERAELVEKVAQGDLTVHVNLSSEKDTLGQALQSMLKNLNQMMAEVSMASERVNAGSTEIAGASQSLSQGGSESAASLEEITSSVTEMASQSSSNAENARQARELSTSAQKYAGEGNERMKEMVRAMAKIQDSSQNISKIIKTIDEIAFQTNLLALNAAVEAARAGQHGKGFAVVAEEVRNLAARSAKAARETAELIEGSADLTAEGSTIAGQTAEELENIVNEVNKVNDLVAEIAIVSEEQAEGVRQVNIGLEQIDRVTQQNMAMAEESAASAEELSGQAERLQEMLKRFRLEGQSSSGFAGGRSSLLLD